MSHVVRDEHSKKDDSPAIIADECLTDDDCKCIEI